jgi:hypothetical protein
MATVGTGWVRTEGVGNGGGTGGGGQALGSSGLHLQGSLCCLRWPKPTTDFVITRYRIRVNMRVITHQLGNALRFEQAAALQKCSTTMTDQRSSKGRMRGFGAMLFPIFRGVPAVHQTNQEIDS